MRNKLILLLTVLIFIVLILAAMVLYDRLGGNAEPGLMVTEPAEDPAAPEPEAPAEDTPAEEAPSAPKNLAPDFTVTDADGNEVRLSDHLGKPVILNFWASWCGPCKMEMPDFQQAYEEYGDEIVFLMVNLTDGYQETQETASAFISSTDYTFPVYYDLSFEAASNYAVSAVPVTYFISAEGEAIAKGQGMLSLESIQKGIDLILPQE